jgi:hypothetical protein
MRLGEKSDRRAPEQRVGHWLLARRSFVDTVDLSVMV